MVVIRQERDGEGGIKVLCKLWYAQRTLTKS